MAVTELGRLPGFRVGSVGPLIISVFEETATVERLALLERLQKDFVAKTGRVYTLNVIIGHTIKSPEAAVREYSAKLQAQFNSVVAGSATVLAVKGLGAVIARGFLAALALIAGGTTPTQVFKSVEEACHWLRTLPEAPASLADQAHLEQDVAAFMASQ